MPRRRRACAQHIGAANLVAVAPALLDDDRRQFYDQYCVRAGLPEKRWHALRHTFGTHAALFGVNPWRLQSWMGHKRIDKTMIYVHLAENHRRDFPECVLEAGQGGPDPDRRIPKAKEAAFAAS